MNFTKEQQQAIKDRNLNILVSASAGSGKTRVLVERVLQRLLAGDNVDEFLIVTFTEAAAAEMRERLENEIRKATVNEEGAQRQHLLRQLRLIKLANISTLHAFAMRLIEQYHYAIDLDPQFRLSDTAEQKLTMMQIFDEVLEQQYNDDEGEFTTFAKQFIDKNGGDTPLQTAVFKLFDFAMARPDTDEWLAQLGSKYESTGDFAESKAYLEELVPQLRQQLTALIDQHRQVIDLVPAADDDVSKNRLKDLEDEVQGYRNILNALQTGLAWQQLRKLFFQVEMTPWNAKGRVAKKDWDPEIKTAWGQVKDARNDNNTHFKDMAKNFFVLDEVGLTTAIKGAQQSIEQLVKLTNQFRSAYLAEKIHRKVFDFNDLEHFALAIVSKPAIAEQLRAHYVEIMVDEYQDTNYLQEAIVQAIAKENNVFQVGDIKQSIYKFRQADPQLFATKMRQYPQPDESNSEMITLAENFRSQPNVTNFINYLFIQLMSADLGDVDYAGPAKLIAGADYYPEELPHKADFLVYFNDGSDDDESTEDDGPELEDATGFTATTGQITMLGQKIQQLMAEKFKIFDRKAGVERPIEYADITILVPSRAQNPQIIDIFKQLGIPLLVNDAGNYFQTTEISIVMDLLKIIDNPHQDIPLAAVLRSPIYQVGENGLALIRAQALEADFYTALKKLVDSPVIPAGVDQQLVERTTEAVTRLENDLNDFRQLAVQNKIVDLLWAIYKRTGWLDYVGGMPSGNQRQANLHALYERAAAYQKTSFTGLYQFNHYIEQLQKNDADDLGEADANEVSDTVKLMTIHGSKGLEFPVVFILNASKKFNAADERGQMLLDAKAGIGMQYLDLDYHLKLTPPQYLTVQDAIHRSSFAEQLRVLYVALTRAEQQIFVVGAYKNPQDFVNKWQVSQYAEARVPMLPEQTRLQGHSFMDLMGMAIARHPKFSETAKTLMKDYGVELETPDSFEPEVAFDFAVEFSSSQDLVVLGDEDVKDLAMHPIETIDSTPLTLDLKEVFEFEYPHETATHATAYQSVSEIKRLFEDPDLIAGQQVVDRRLKSDVTAGLRFTNDELREPAFLTEMATRPSGAARGTATHLVMQKLDLTQGTPTLETVQKLIEALIEEELIEPTLENLLPVKQVVEFFQGTPLGKQMVQNTNELQREVPFSMLMDAKSLYADFKGDERVLVHGIIDGYFMVGDELWLYDYKTDYIAPGVDAKKFLTDRYAAQLNVYSAALTAMGKNNIRRFIMSFGADKVFEI
ncbi:MAG: helicase-exonuclease AddAB subunit AddA [Lactobacillaceae bacterium]|jgi:ATP-dependent helicase/nuclease subunit A|nr:helicase-exonuclease AddAB subunit AddA [Lactobacillaceae bacterium]